MRQLVIILLAILAGACSAPAHLPSSGEGGTIEFEPDAPNFDLGVVASVRDGASGIDVEVSIPHHSLIFVKRDSVFAARFDMIVQVRPVDSASDIVSESWSDTARVSHFESTGSDERIFHHYRYDLPGGRYIVNVALEISGSEARAERHEEVDVFDAEARAMGEVGLRSRRSGGPFEPELSYHLRAGYDSLRAVTELFNVGDEADARFTLVRLLSDTLAASPPFWFTPGPFSLAYRGVDYEEGDTVQVTHRRVRNAAEQVTIEFSLPDLERGNYVAEISVEAPDEGMTARRYFSVKRAEFPRILSLREMAEALVYIAREGEIRHILAAPDHDEMKKRFDAFWAQRVPNREAAASLLQTYYSRVEEANLLFSNHKEGWKTDRGMVYIVFGSPAYTETHHMAEHWYYFEAAFPVSQRLPPFIFRKSGAYGLNSLFDNYILQRAEAYELIWQRRVERWREGRAL